MNLKQDTIDKLRQIMAYIKEEPRRLDMLTWGTRFDPSSKEKAKLVLGWALSQTESADDEELPPCGTAACLAGTAMILFAPDKIQHIKDDDFAADKIFRFGSNTEYLAADVLGLDYYTAHMLFMSSNWPDELHSAYRYNGRQNRDVNARIQARYEVTNRAVEAFIAGDGNMFVGLEKLKKEETEPK